MGAFASVSGVPLVESTSWAFFQAIRTRHYSYRTEEACVGWVRRFILFHPKRPPGDMGKKKSHASSPVRKAGMSKPASCHIFQHLFGTHLLEDGYDIRTVQELLRHRDVSTTMMYTHVLNRGGRGVYSPAARLGLDLEGPLGSVGIG